MTGLILDDDYLDPDVAYLLGMIAARGTLLDRQPARQIIIEFPYQNLEIELEQGTERPFPINVPQSIELGLSRIRERVLELMDCDVSINKLDKNFHMVMTLTRRTLAWRNVLLHLNNKTSFRHMNIPAALLHSSATTDMRMEFIRGYADVAGNVRRANRYRDGRNRVRLDVLNDNWHLPVQLCRLLQEFLDIPVQLITWGHPSLGRGMREHQINIFVKPFARVGFSFEHKQRALLTLIEQDADKPNRYQPCPGRRRLRKAKPFTPDAESERLPPEARQHFDAYWQICKALGCTVEPASGPMFEAVDEDIEET
jgi:hypothetical protein